MDESAIRVQGLGKRYWLGSGDRRNTLRDALAGLATRLTRRQAHEPRHAFWALRGVDFTIGRGESVGIIGLNGAGKSTLLKVLARIVEPTTGEARVAGRVGALLEVGTGFHWELSGRENVFLYGSILGMRRQEIAQRFDSIVDFAGVREFIDTPVKRYSSGMYVRLAFAVAAHLHPDILIVDEVLSVGDLPFQRKCMEFAHRLQQESSTILFVSHNMFAVKSMCSRVIFLREGQVVYDGPTAAGIELFEHECRLSALAWTGRRADEWPVRITECELLDDRGAACTLFAHGDPMQVVLHWEADGRVPSPNFIVALVRDDGTACCNYSTEADGLQAPVIAGRGRLRLRIPALRLVAGAYSLHLLVRQPGFQDLLGAQSGGTFHVHHDLLDENFGIYHERGDWDWPEAGLRDARRRLAGGDPR